MKFGRQPLIVIIIYLIIYSSISLVNHYNFKTFAWDLGINNNAIYDYAHFRWNDCMILQPQFTNILADHFTLLPILISPLYWVFGTYTMLIFQICAILFGGIGIYKYFNNKTSNATLSLIAMIHFYSLWGIFSALGFDYHDNVIGAMLVPWLFYYFEREKWKTAAIYFLLICMSKENMALWAVFISFTLGLLNYKSPKVRKASALFGLFALIYFFFVVKVIIPSIANEGREYLHFNYKAIGNNFSEAIHTLVFRPQYAFSLLFENNTGWNEANFIKSELHFFVLLSGGYAILYKPQYLLMLLPIYAQKLYNDDIGKWGLNYQYSIELVPILTLALYTFLYEINKRHKIYYLLLPCLITIVATASSMDHRISKWYQPEQVRFYDKKHYQTEYNVAEINEMLKVIPKNAVVSASNSLVPHLAFRDYIYQFPITRNAEYIVLLKSGNTYPLSKEEFENKITDYNNSNEWEKITDQNYLVIYKHH